MHTQTPAGRALVRFLFTLALSLCSACVASAPKLGIQTWTLRALDFDQVVDFCVKHDIQHIQAIAKHLDPNAPPEETRRKKAILDQRGLSVYTFGVAGTSLKMEDNRKLFDFAKEMGIQLIVVEPRSFLILDQLEALAKEYDIRVAIHNHGIKSLYGNPTVVRALLEGRDRRMGVCLDVGWVTSARFDAGKVFREYDGRVFDIHLKDKKVNNTDKGDVATPAGIGEGDVNFDGLFQALKETRYDGVLAIETDKFLQDPTSFVAQAKAFVQSRHP